MAATPNSVSRAKPRLKAPIIDKRILLVEDQKSLSMVIKEMLVTRWGCEIISAYSMQDAIDAIATYHGDFFVAISDLNLPDANDGEVIDVLRKSNIPTVAVTGNVKKENIEKVRSKGVIDYVLKSSINAYSYVTDLVGRLHSNTQKTALVVGDSDDDNRRIGGLLACQLLTVDYVNDEKMVVDRVRQNEEIKLVIINFSEKAYDPEKLIASIRNNYDMKNLAVMVISKFVDGPLPEISLKLGANDFMSAPFSDAEFFSRVNHELDLQDTYSSLEFLAFHDELTGLYNRRAFFDLASKQHTKSTSTSSSLALMMIDIDHFKKINDSYGHDVGDLVLKDFSTQLKAFFEGKIVARVGGEEFVVVVEGTPEIEAYANTLVSEIASRKVAFENNELSYTISMGLTLEKGDNIDAMMKVADTYLYKAKTSGRNRLVSDQT